MTNETRPIDPQNLRRIIIQQLIPKDKSLSEVIKLLRKESTCSVALISPEVFQDNLKAFGNINDWSVIRLNLIPDTSVLNQPFSWNASVPVQVHGYDDASPEVQQWLIDSALATLSQETKLSMVIVGANDLPLMVSNRCLIFA